VQQLTTLDRMFSSLDSPTTNATLGGLVLFDPPDAGQAVPDEAFMRRRLTERLRFIPPMNRQVVKAPLPIDHDYLARPSRIDVAEHLRTIRLEAPGTPAQLAAEVSRIMGTSLRKDRPLWDYTIIEGLEDGSVAHLLRIDHLVVDGGSMPSLWTLLSDDPSEDLVADPAYGHPEPLYGRAELVVRQALGLAVRPVAVTRLNARLAGWAVGQVREHGPLAIAAAPTRLLPGKRVRSLLNPALAKRGIAESVPYVEGLRARPTPFNNRVGSERAFVYADLPLADFKDAGKALGGSINDAVLAVCAGALRRYLQDNDVEVDTPLTVCVPVSLRQGGEEPRWANWVHMIFAPLPTHLEDPADRLRFARSAVAAAKANFDALPTHLLREASRFLPPILFNAAVPVMTRVPALSRSAWNVVVSNVRGPSRPDHFNGLRVRGYVPASFLSIGGGINITLQSYTDRIFFGVMSSPQQCPELETLLDHMREELEALVAAAERETSTRSQDQVRQKDRKKVQQGTRKKAPGGTARRASAAERELRSVET
jgi:WS/DGAT/MGAT family acyltransferase